MLRERKQIKPTVIPRYIKVCKIHREIKPYEKSFNLQSLFLVCSTYMVPADVATWHWKNWSNGKGMEILFLHFSWLQRKFFFNKSTKYKNITWNIHFQRNKNFIEKFTIRKVSVKKFQSNFAESRNNLLALLSP